MDRRDFLKLGGVGIAGAALLGSAGAGRTFARTDSSLRSELESASRQSEVPVELLLAMGYVNTLWEMPPPQASDYEAGELEGRGAYGIMSLYENPSRDTLGRAAGLTGISEEELKTSRAANIRGGTALLAEIQGAEKPSDINGWYDAVAEYGDGSLYANQVYETLKNGVSGSTMGGEKLILPPQEGVQVPQLVTAQGGTDYPRAVWRGADSSNYTYSRRERTYNIHRVVIHVAQGSAASAIGWFGNPSADVSAHYVVNRNGKVSQCVRHKNIAWHAGNWWYNCHSIGIEHAGYGGNPNTWTRAMYRASARLTAYVCRKHRIPVDRKHILAHRQTTATRCPGRYFNFRRYLRLVRRYR